MLKGLIGNLFFAISVGKKFQILLSFQHNTSNKTNSQRSPMKTLMMDMTTL